MTFFSQESNESSRFVPFTNQVSDVLTLTGDGFLAAASPGNIDQLKIAGRFCLSNLLTAALLPGRRARTSHFVIMINYPPR